MVSKAIWHYCIVNCLFPRRPILYVETQCKRMMKVKVRNRLKTLNRNAWPKKPNKNGWLRKPGRHLWYG